MERSRSNEASLGLNLYIFLKKLFLCEVELMGKEKKRRNF